MKKEKDFPQVYDNDFLEELIREFSFKPTEIRNPKILSKKDIQSFDENGFLSGIFLTWSFLDILSFLPTDLFFIC